MTGVGTGWGRRPARWAVPVSLALFALCAPGALGQDSAAAPAGESFLRMDRIAAGVAYAVPGAFDYWSVGPSASWTSSSLRSPASFFGWEFRLVRLLFDRTRYLEDNTWRSLPPGTETSGSGRLLASVSAAWTRTATTDRTMLLGTLGLGVHVASGGEVLIAGAEGYSASGLFAVGLMAGGGVGYEISAGKSLLVEPAVHLALFPFTWASLSLRVGMIRWRG